METRLVVCIKKLVKHYKVITAQSTTYGIDVAMKVTMITNMRCIGLEQIVGSFLTDAAAAASELFLLNVYFK